MIKVGFLGIGQAGGNIADIAYQRNFPAAAINTSREDLESLNLPNNKFIVGNVGGAAKDRKIAINELKEYYTGILENVNNWITTEKLDVVILVFSTGGGTGSGMGPVLANLLKKTIDKTIVLMPILPSNNEPVGSFINTVECMQSVIKLNFPTIVIDNEKFRSQNENSSKRKIYDGVNSELLDNIEIILDAPSKKSKYGNIDNRDIKRIFATPGVMSIGVMFDEDIEDNVDPNIIQTCFNRSIFSQLEYDKQIKCLAIIYQCSEKMVNNFNDKELFKVIGTPLEVYEGVYEPDIDSVGENIVFALCGLSYPMSRINEMMNIIDSEKEVLTSKRDYSNISFDSDFEWLTDLKKESRDQSIQFLKEDKNDTSKEKKISKEEANSLFDDYL